MHWQQTVITKHKFKKSESVFSSTSQSTFTVFAAFDLTDVVRSIL